MEYQDLVTVYTLSNPLKAEIIKNALEEEGIRCRLDGSQQAGEAGLTAFEVGILVRAGDADRARKLIMRHDHETDSDQSSAS